MSDELLKRIERMSIPEKIEFAIRFYPNVQGKFLNRGREPYQSFDLLRKMRNSLVHYIPEKELVWAESGEHINNVKELENKLVGKFPFMSPRDITPGDSTKSFLDRVFNRHCAKWSFERVAPFIDALSKTFQIETSPLQQYWSLDGTKN